MDTMQNLIARVKDFASQINLGSVLMQVYHNPENEAIPLRCFENVTAKVEKDGGRPIYGWIFGHHESQFGEYLTATHHAVWLALDNTLLDVTPFAEPQYGYIIKASNYVVFLPDELALRIRGEGVGAPLPTKFFALSDNSELREYLKQQVEKEQRECQEIYEGKINS
jgi:hypothetical protein